MSGLMPENSAIKVTKSLEQQLQGVTNVEQIKEIMREAALSQNLAHRDWDPAILVPNEPSTTPSAFSRTVTIDGQTHTIKGATETELLQAETAIYRAAMAQPAITTQQTEQPRGTDGRFTAVEQAETERVSGLRAQLYIRA
jgi:hypothetical protein